MSLAFPSVMQLRPALLVTLTVRCCMLLFFDRGTSCLGVTKDGTESRHSSREFHDGRLILVWKLAEIGDDGSMSEVVALRPCMLRICSW